jgi:hypothetical protein
VMRSRIGIRLPATALPVDEVPGPARMHLRDKTVTWQWYAMIAVLACVLAWLLGGR